VSVSKLVKASQKKKDVEEWLTG